MTRNSDPRADRIEKLQRQSVRLRALLKGVSEYKEIEGKVWCDKMRRHYREKLARVLTELDRWHRQS